ncbi:glycosyltransferase family 2 protein [Flavobacterium qiangtangense]|uniref:Glycosyltransferase family 2 protein n=1 Tax=Flavobacterium qiangtangense TaxID=1442595 RepID=A0ABW1PMB4_9FLAO
MKKIAVVILNWNGKKLLEEFLPSIVRFSPEATIYLADNASSDDSISFVKNTFSSIKIIQNTDNFGFAKGYNQAMRFVEEDYYALVNSDIEVTENWLAPILEIFENQPETAIIQPKILDYKNKEMFEYAGAGGGFIDKYGFPFCRGRIFQSLEKDNNQYNDEIDIFWASGACFFIRKEIFRKLNGFDEDFFAHQEEIDLCWRAFNLNYKVKYTGKSTVYHVGGATLKESSPHKTFLNFRNSLWMMLKNVPQRKLFQTMFVRLFLDGQAGIQFALHGKFPHLWAILKAHFYFYLLIFKFLNKRESNQYVNYYKINSIVYYHFIKKGKVFESNFNNSL